MTIDKFEGEYRFLSNFYPQPVIFEGMLFPSVEHAYQAAKTLDWDHRERIRALRSPSMAKSAGPQIKKAGLA